MAMRRLGYSEPWLRAGVVSAEEVVAQAELYDRACANPDDEELGYYQSPEHHRWSAFMRFIESRKTVSDAVFDALVDAGIAEVHAPPDMPSIGASLLLNLIDCPIVTASQRARLISLEIDDSYIRVAGRRRTLKEALSYNPHEPSHQDAALRFAWDKDGQGNRDSVMERWLVNHLPVTALALARLAVEGRAKAIRNTAKQRLKRGR
ncbi:MAG: hypothetical protein AAF577_01060 [Pseudomonadota bacterium]